MQQVNKPVDHKTHLPHSRTVLVENKLKYSGQVG